MIIIRVMGGLGNQMQQYALYRKLEILGRDVRLDTSWYEEDYYKESGVQRRKFELDKFIGVTYKKATEEEVMKLIGRSFGEPEHKLDKVFRIIRPEAAPVFEESEMYHPEVFDFTEKYLVGHWACEKYYSDILDVLRKEFRFPKCADEKVRLLNMELEQQIGAQNAVSIHIRRGDYLDPINQELFKDICTDEYYKSAIACVRKCLESYVQSEKDKLLGRAPAKTVFYIFSDDCDYCRKTFVGDEYVIVDINNGENSFFDMCLMSKCKYNIVANSTFSFWGARLNGYDGKVMIRPSIHKNSQVFEPDKMHDYWPGWVLISPAGEVV